MGGPGKGSKGASKGGWVWQPAQVQQSWGKKGAGKGQGEGTGKKASTVPANFTVNTSKSYTGTVMAYFKLKGYGFIELSQKGVAPEDKVFCFWTDISSSDRFPALMKETEVKFNLRKETKKGETSLRACNVTNTDGSPIAIQDEADEKRTYVGGQFLRYTGTLKFYIPKRGYGYVTVDDGFDYGGMEVPKEIRVETSEINAGGGQPDYAKEVQVEFGIWKTRKEQFKAHNMTLPGGEPLPAKAGE